MQVVINPRVRSFRVVFILCVNNTRISVTHRGPMYHSPLLCSSTPTVHHFSSFSCFLSDHNFLGIEICPFSVMMGEDDCPIGCVRYNLFVPSLQGKDGACDPNEARDLAADIIIEVYKMVKGYAWAQDSFILYVDEKLGVLTRKQGQDLRRSPEILY